MARRMFSSALVSVPETETEAEAEAETAIGVFENGFVFFASVIGSRLPSILCFVLCCCFVLPFL